MLDLTPFQHGPKVSLILQSFQKKLKDIDLVLASRSASPPRGNPGSVRSKYDIMRRRQVVTYLGHREVIEEVGRLQVVLVW